MVGVFIGNAENWISLAIARSLGKKNVTVDAGSESGRTITFCCRYVDAKHRYPNEVSDMPGFLEKIREISRNDYDLMIFTTESTLLPASSNRGKLKNPDALALPSHKQVVKASDKGQVMRLAKELNIPHPKTLEPRDLEDALSCGKTIGYPLVLKPSRGAGAVGVTYCNNPGELERSWEKLDDGEKKFLVQERIPASGKAYGYEGLFNRDGKARASFTHRRIREYPVSGGPSSFCISELNKKIMEQGIEILEDLGWYGPVMAEFKQDPRDGEYKLLEINPRFWGSLSLSIKSGIDFPYLLYKMVKEGDVEKKAGFKEGMVSRHILKDARHFRHVLLHGSPQGGSRLGYAASILNFRGNSFYVASFTDPKPFLTELSEPIERKIKKLTEGAS